LPCNYFFLKGFCCFILVCTVFSCTIRSKKETTYGSKKSDAYAAYYQKIDSGSSLLIEGDLVVRSGEEPASQFIRQLNRQNKTYSHAGIVFFQNGYPFIYHLVAGDENPDEKLRKDSLLHFANPRKNSGFAVYRYNLDHSEVKNLKQILENWYQQGLSFDYHFNLHSNDKMYCSEMIKKALAAATNKRITVQTTTPTEEEKVFYANRTGTSLASLKGMTIVSIDNLYNNVNCRLVKSFQFNR
jgi:hypothetical protein